MGPSCHLIVAVAITLLSGINASNVVVKRTGPVRQPSCVDFTPFVYAGCFKDDSSIKTLLYASNLPSKSMTIEKCVAFCKGNDYKYAGLEYYGECYCGASVNAVQIEEKSCNFPCNGNKTESCGGGGIISVYQDPTFPVVDKTTISDYMSMGCYTEGPNGRTLGWRQDNVNPATMTVESCLSACLAGGYAFAGVEFGRECYCGVVLGNGTLPLNSAECDIRCTGDKNQFCGGRSKLNLYVARSLESTEPCEEDGPVTSSTLPPTPSVTSFSISPSSTTSTPITTTAPSTSSSASASPSISSSFTSSPTSTASETSSSSTTSFVSSSSSSTTTSSSSGSGSTPPSSSSSSTTASSPDSFSSSTTPSVSSSTSSDTSSGITTSLLSSTVLPTPFTTSRSIQESSRSSLSPLSSSTSANPPLSSSSTTSSSPLTTATSTSSNLSGLSSNPATISAPTSTISPGVSSSTPSSSIGPSSFSTSTANLTSSSTSYHSSTISSLSSASSTPTSVSTSTIATPSSTSTFILTFPSLSTTPIVTYPPSITSTTTIRTYGICTSIYTIYPPIPSPTCEYRVGEWCANPIPEFGDTFTCLKAFTACVKQLSTCFSKAGYPDTLRCNEFNQYCSRVADYCDDFCPGNSCTLSGCKKVVPPPYGPPAVPTYLPGTIYTTLYSCPLFTESSVTLIPATSTLVSATRLTTTPALIITTTSSRQNIPTPVPVPTYTNICNQPNNPSNGYGPSYPVGGIPLPNLSCNNEWSDYNTGHPFKLYTSSDTYRCPSYEQTGDYGPVQGCRDACDEQFKLCNDGYAEPYRGYKKFKRSSRDDYYSASRRCANQRDDCYSTNRVVNGDQRCRSFNTGY